MPASRGNVPIDRRRFLGFLVAGPTLTYAAIILDGTRPRWAAAGIATPEVADRYDLVDEFMTVGTPFYYDLLIEITRENRVRFEVPRMEMGQGVITGAAMMLADNLDARLDDIDASLSPAEVRRQTGQFTATSHSMRSLWDPIRVIAGEMRARLATAGAHHLGVPAGTVRTEDTHVVATDGRRVPYGAISEAAARVVPEVAPLPKSLDQLKMVGYPCPRLDARDLVTGRTKFAADLDVPGALPTVLALPGRLGATVVSVDDSAARAMPGVVAVTAIPGMPDTDVAPAVAVVAETIPQALAARRALAVEWSAGPMDAMSDGEIRDLLYSILDPVAAPDTGQVVDAYFEWPYVSHAPMETNDAVADVRADGAEIWTGTQTPVFALQTIARTLGMTEEQVALHVVQCGGSFGRRLYCDAAVQAAQVSQRVGRPVKLVYSRGDDTRHGRHRPASVHHVRATVAGGDVVSFEHRMAGALLGVRHGWGEHLSGQAVGTSPEAVNQTVFHLSQKVPYRVGATSLSLQERPLAVPTASWRSVYSGTCSTVNEIVIDELARLVGRDEYEFRRELLDNDRGRAVLDTVARAGKWGRPMPPGTAQGIGMHDEYKSVVAVLVECDARGPEPRITRATIAVDVGRVVNPKGLEGQLIGAMTDAVSVVFWAGTHLDRGAIREGAAVHGTWAAMRHVPFDVDIHILPPTSEVPGGAGELGLPAASAAVANAWARATGRTPRRFPINEHGA